MHFERVVTVDATSPRSFAGQDTPGPVFRLQCVREVRLRAADGSDCTPRSRKTRALFVYAVLSGGKAVGRERLAALLWGDRGDEQARASVRQALYELRQLSNEKAPLLNVTREHVVADLRFIAVDIHEIEAHAKAGDIPSLCDTLAGEPLTLLSDLDGITPEFDDWLRTQRTHRLDRITGSAVAAGASVLERGDPERVRSLATALEMIDPLCEPAVRLGIRTDLLLGDPTSALRRYKRLEERLRRDLEAEPSVETRTLLQQLDALNRADVIRLNGHSTEVAIAGRPVPDLPLPAAVNVPRDLPTGNTTAAPRVRRWHLVAAILIFLGLSAAVISLFPIKQDQSPAVAILPFKELPSRGAAGHFASGVAEEILDLLARDSKVRVLGSTSTRLFATRPDTRDVARTLGVTHLLEGSVRSQGNRVRVSVRLIQADKGTQLWVEEYERALDDTFGVQQEIAASVARHLSGTLSPSRSSAYVSTNAEVYHRFVQARSLMLERRESTIARARTLLLEAVALDPDYAPAWANLAIATVLLCDYSGSYGGIPFEEARQQASHYASRALALAPDLAAAHAAIGLISLKDASSIPHYRRAINLEPQQAEYHRWLGQAQARLGRHGEALKEYRRSAELEPLWAPAAVQLVHQLAEMGRYDEMDDEVRRFVGVSKVPRDIRYVRLTAFQKRGQIVEMLDVARRLAQELRESGHSDLKMAAVLAGLGDYQAALALVPRDQILRRAVISRDLSLIASLARKDPDAFWNKEMDDSGAGELLVAGGRGKLLLELFDGRYRSVDQFWMEDEEAAIGQAPPLIVALREAGRTAEANKLNKRALQRIDADIRAGLVPESWAVERAQHLALSGADAAALTELERAMRARWTDLLRAPFTPPAQWSALHVLASHPRLLALQRELQQRVDAARARAQAGSSAT